MQAAMNIPQTVHMKHETNAGRGPCEKGRRRQVRPDSSAGSSRFTRPCTSVRCACAEAAAAWARRENARRTSGEAPAASL
eukprot:4089721-Pleurochrysis_carterae.AAC.4